jgi:hypothetical protein
MMAETLVNTAYFKETGPQNTERTLELAKQRACELGIHTVLVATTSGMTALKAAEVFRGCDCDVVAVTHSTGFSAANVQELSDESRAAIEAVGVRVLTAQHALGGINRAVRKKLGTYELDEIVAYTLRIFGQGMKVCAEISMMAADAGLVRTGEPCIVIGGTGRGADTAVVLVPVNAQDFFDLRVMEVIAKPRLE